MRWEGNPTAFAFRYPYIVAFDSSFIEIRHIDTVSVCVCVCKGELTRVVSRATLCKSYLVIISVV